MTPRRALAALLLALLLGCGGGDDGVRCSIAAIRSMESKAEQAAVETDQVKRDLLWFEIAQLAGSECTGVYRGPLGPGR